MKQKINPLEVGLVFMIAIIISGCVSQGKYDAALKENDALEKQNRSLQGNVKLTRNQKDLIDQDLYKATEDLSTTTRELADSRKEADDAARTSDLYVRLAENLSDEIASQKITIKQMKHGVTLNLPEGILFDSGSARVKISGNKVLDKVAIQLKNAHYQTIVGGFTDNVPISKRLAIQFPSNWELSAVRATTVARKLENSGIPKSRLLAVAFGENQPVASNDTKEGRAKNRRIEIRLRPILTE